MNLEDPQPRLDRLANLVQGLAVASVVEGAEPDAELSISADGAQVTIGTDPAAVVSIRLHPGRAAGPLSALRGRTFGIKAEAQVLARLLVDEVTAPRCGSQSLRASYARALIIHLLREELAADRVKTGLLAGLSDARLSRALVAIHDDPGRNWQAAALAEEAGMSRAAFMRAFRATVGETPIGYLRRWRLERAREALARGARVGQVAHALGYGSIDAFSRAFRSSEGVLPSHMRTRDTAGDGSA